MDTGLIWVYYKGSVGIILGAGSVGEQRVILRALWEYKGLPWVLDLWENKGLS